MRRRPGSEIRANDLDDSAANLALGNIYERLFRKTQKAELLEASNQAIVRVRNSEKTSADQRVEALTLEGRNEKTLWRLKWDKLDNVGERRSAATNRTLRKAYEAYRKAYLFDLNHDWSGLAALQQGTMTLELSKEEMWQDTFDNVGEALAYQPELKRQLEALHPTVSQAIETALARMSGNDQNRVWPKSSARTFASIRGAPKPGDRGLQRSGSQKSVLRLECGERSSWSLHKARLQARTREEGHFDDRDAARGPRLTTLATCTW